MIRLSYFEHPDYVPLLRRAYDLWDELEEREGAARSVAGRILHRTGGLYIGPPDGVLVPGSLAAAREHGLPHELLDHSALATRFPAFRVPENFCGFFEAQAGFLVPELAVAAHARRAQAHGAELHTNEPVHSWSCRADGVTVRTAKDTYHAGQLVVTAGAWNGALLHDLKVELAVTRQVLAWFDPGGGQAAFALGSFPCWFVETDSPAGHYGFPMLDSGQRGLKFALHKRGEVIPPGDLGAADHEVRAEEIEALRETMREILPGGDGPLLAACTCRYTNSADGHFILGAHPQHARLTIAAGFSGHGFKFASVMGEILADLAAEGRTSHPIAFLSPERFAG
jgi:sarcosine oxidase